ncbi:hypothetical protein KK120_18610 [Virgibacillus dakarensis]|nr:hypothetical protein [Virgibacillus dakarensis]
MINKNKEPFMANYKFYLEEDGAEKYIGKVTEDGATLKLESDSKEIINGEDKSILRKYKFIKNGRLDFALNVFDYDTLALSLPNSTSSSSKDFLKIRSGVVNLHDHLQKFIGRPVGYENDDTKKIVIYAAVNDNDNEFSFKVDEETTIPFSLLCLKDEDGNFIDIGVDKTIDGEE